MQLIILIQLIFLSLVVKGRKKGYELYELEHNEIIDKNTLIQVKFPKMDQIYVSRKPTLKKRNFDINVVPIKENCHTETFKTQLAKLRQEVKCMPRDTLVNLIPPTGASIIPNAVTVKRCGGSCSNYRSCQSQYKINTEFYVKTIENNTVSCSKISVPEHTKCKCGCQKKESSCNEKQIYDKRKCDCVCKNENEFSDCLKNSNKHLRWDRKKCACVCSTRNKTCTTGTLWVENKCRCVRIDS